MKLMQVSRTMVLALAALATLMALAAGGCGTTSKPASDAKTKEITSQKAGDLVVSLENEAGELAQGQNRFALHFRSGASGQPVDVGKVTLGSSMAMPGMAPMVAAIESQSAGQNGIYAFTGDFAGSGAWKFEVRWDGPAGQGTTSFSTNVR